MPLGPVPFPAAFGVPADAPVSVAQFLRLLDRYRTSAHQAPGESSLPSTDVWTGRPASPVD